MLPQKLNFNKDQVFGILEILQSKTSEFFYYKVVKYSLEKPYCLGFFAVTCYHFL
jgi:hypothetical protein